MGLRVRRVYEPPAPSDGRRVLVDRLWPRGLRRETARIDAWASSLAPSDRLRRWFAHDPARFAEFRRRYRAELGDKLPELLELNRRAAAGTLTLLFAARDAEHSNARVLAERLAELTLRARPRSARRSPGSAPAARRRARRRSSRAPPRA